MRKETIDHGIPQVEVPKEEQNKKYSMETEGARALPKYEDIKKILRLDEGRMLVIYNHQALSQGADNHACLIIDERAIDGEWDEKNQLFYPDYPGEILNCKNYKLNKADVEITSIECKDNDFVVNCPVCDTKIRVIKKEMPKGQGREGEYYCETYGCIGKEDNNGEDLWGANCVHIDHIEYDKSKNPKLYFRKSKEQKEKIEEMPEVIIEKK
ncbi:hypothetical protein KAS41_02410 [Candidatus Parcubacteria bacterium]|nr:hypothetical protein [Candidatus Parcubacteria bacterium]